MNNYRLISDYKDHDVYRESFNELAKLVFGLDFKKWYGKGCWNDNYICYSYVDGNQIIANASINKMKIVSNDRDYKAIQVGTVKTHPKYRNQGLSTNLKNLIIDQYEKEYDFIYLFANKTVLDFYPKFKFTKVQESSFSMDITKLKKQNTTGSYIRKLDINNKDDFRLMNRLAKERIPISSLLGVKDNRHLLMFYFIVVFSNAIYYLEEEDVIIMCEEENQHLHIYDIISKNKVEFDLVLNHLISDETKMFHFYFTPDLENSYFRKEFITESEDTLFVTIAITINDISKTKEVYDKLQDGGEILMPLQETFWSASYGQVLDKFGVTWQISTQFDAHQ